MKRLCLILFVLLLLLAAPAMAEEPLQLARMSGPMLGSGGGAADPCGCPTSTYMFCYTGDYSGDTDKACFANGTVTKDGTISGASVSADYVQFDAANEYVTWAVSSSDGIDSDIGTIFFTLYLIDRDSDTDVGLMQLIETCSVSGCASEGIVIVVNAASDKITVYHEGQNAGAQTAVSSATVSFGTTYRVGVSWSRADSKLSVSVVEKGSETSWAATNKTLTEWGEAEDDITIGENVYGWSMQETARISDVIIFSTYLASDPNK